MSMEWSTSPWDSSRLSHYFNFWDKYCSACAFVCRVCEDSLVRANGFCIKQIGTSLMLLICSNDVNINGIAKIFTHPASLILSYFPVSQKGSEILLTEVSSCVPHYGVSDLKQVLGEIEDSVTGWMSYQWSIVNVWCCIDSVAVVAYEGENGSLCPLAQSRPVKVETFFKVSMAQFVE